LHSNRVDRLYGEKEADRINRIDGIIKEEMTGKIIGCAMRGNQVLRRASLIL
jgi:hypothetical protein